MVLVIVQANSASNTSYQRRQGSLQEGNTHTPMTSPTMREG